MGGVTHHTAETRRIISEKIKERWRDPQYRRRILASNNGSLNQETREKIAATLRKRWEDPEFRKQMTGKIARAKSEEHRQRISAAIRSKWDDESYRERTLNGIWQRSKEVGPTRATPWFGLQHVRGHNHPFRLDCAAAA